MKKTVPFLLLIILFAAAAWYSFVKEPDPLHELPTPDVPPAMPVEVQQAEPQLEDVVGYREPEPVIVPDPLPPLGESDIAITGALAELTGVDPLAQYLVKTHAISRFVAMIDSMTSRQVPASVNPIKPVDDVFVVETQGERIVMSAENFARYDGYVALLQSLDTRAVMKVYRRHYPLVQQAWVQNGGEGTFRKRMLEVIDHLLETPDVPGPVYLIKPEAVYLFEEPELEAMTAGQKILVRMGSVNASVVKDKLTEIKLRMN